MAQTVALGRQAIINREAGAANKLFTVSDSDLGVSAQHDFWGHTPKCFHSLPCAGLLNVRPQDSGFQSSSHSF